VCVCVCVCVCVIITMQPIADDLLTKVEKLLQDNNETLCAFEDKVTYLYVYIYIDIYMYIHIHNIYMNIYTHA